MKITYEYDGHRRRIPSASEQDGIYYLVHLAALDIIARLTDLHVSLLLYGTGLHFTVKKGGRRWRCATYMQRSGVWVVLTKEVKPRVHKVPAVCGT